MVDNSDDSSQRKIQVLNLICITIYNAIQKVLFNWKWKFSGKHFEFKNDFYFKFCFTRVSVGAVAVRRDEVVKIHLGSENDSIESGNDSIGSEYYSIGSEYDLRDQIWKQTKKYLSLKVYRLSESEIWKHNNDARHDAISTKIKIAWPHADPSTCNRQNMV